MRQVQVEARLTSLGQAGRGCALYRNAHAADVFRLELCAVLTHDSVVGQQDGEDCTGEPLALTASESNPAEVPVHDLSADP